MGVQPLPPSPDDHLAIYPAADCASPLAAYDAMFRDLVFVCPTRELSLALSADGVDVHAYQLV